MTESNAISLVSIVTRTPSCTMKRNQMIYIYIDNHKERHTLTNRQRKMQTDRLIDTERDNHKEKHTLTIRQRKR